MQGLAEYMSKCLTCQWSKGEHQRHAGLLQPLEIPEWKWDSVSMDFVMGLPKTRSKNNTIRAMLDRLSKFAHFIAMVSTWTLDQLTRAYLSGIVRMIGTQGSKQDFDRSYKRHSRPSWTLVWHFTLLWIEMPSVVSRQIEDMLRPYVLDFNKACDEQLIMMEFSYNNAYHSSTWMSPFIALYNRRCKTPSCEQQRSLEF